MTLLNLQRVLTRPVTLKAVQFDGSQDQGLLILQWMMEQGLQFAGHFRPGVGEAAGALFVPTAHGAWRVDAGGWLLRSDEGVILMITAEKFAECYEVAGCLLH